MLRAGAQEGQGEIAASVVLALSHAVRNAVVHGGIGVGDKVGVSWYTKRSAGRLRSGCPSTGADLTHSMCVQIPTYRE